MTTLQYEESDGVATVTINRPERHNAFTLVTADEFTAVWRHVRECPDVRAVVVTGAGDKAFCTGIDRTEIRDDQNFDGLTYEDPGRMLGPRANSCWKPVIAAVNGMACGGAFYLIAEADFIVAAEHATFFDPHVTFAMAAVFEPALLVHRMPFGEVARLALMGSYERLGAERAYQTGLVSEVVPAADLLSTAHTLAAQIASQPPIAVQTTVRAVWAARELTRQQMIDAGNAFLAIGTTPEALAQGQQTFSAGQRITPRIR